MPLEIVTSNRLEELGTALASRLREAPLPPLAMEQVLVQSRGMARWLDLKLAVENGVAAGVEYLFPNNLVDRILAGLSPGALGGDSVRRVTGWLLAGILEREDIDPGVGAYAASSGLHRLQLAFALADLFDQYTVYRPDMILEWDRGRGEHWQARLWRRLREQWRQPHRAAVRDRLLRDRDAGRAAAAQLPPRLSVFGISSLPPFHVKILKRLAEWLEVTFYLLSPCRGLWSDIVGEREKGRLSGGHRVDPDSLHLDLYNPLLASLGRQGADFLGLLVEEDADFRDGTAAATAAPDPRDPLALVRHDILNNVVPGREGAESPLEVEAGDLRPTITFHDCSSRMREVEVLREELFAIFASDPEISCSEVVVMVPDIAAYAPLVDAVFGDGREPRIPYTIADRPLLGSRGVTDAFLAILALPGERYRMGAVAALLEKEPLRRRFGLDAAGADRAMAWLAAAGVRWGLDASCRERLGAPATGENTWQGGIDRLLAGYAAGGAPGCATFMGIAPMLRPGNEEAGLIGRMVTALETVFSLCVGLDEPAGLEAWHGRLSRIATMCLAPGPEDEDEYSALMEVIDSLALASDHGFSGVVGLDGIIGHLSRELGRSRRRGGFLAGGITFCEMLPMRSIPFQAICLLGMDYDAFPRRDRTGSLDLMAASPRPGDRSRRRDDRYLFLEILVSARRYLYLSHVGRDGSSRAERPPSVLVSELAEYLDRRLVLAGGGRRVSEALGRVHPVASWSPLNFMPGRCRSFSREDLECARSLGAGGEPAGLYPAAVAAGGDSDDATLAVMEDFFTNPARFFCRRGLGIRLPREVTAPEDTEPFALDGLSRYRVDTMILAALASGTPAGSCLARLRSEGLLPHGSRGDFVFASRLAEMERLEAERRRHAPDGLERRVVEAEVAGTVVAGEVEISPAGRVVMARPGSIRGRDRLVLWLRLLAASACGVALDGVCVGIGNDGVATVELTCPEDPAAVLAGLVAVFREGSRRLLPLFPEASLAFASRDAAGDRDGGMSEARLAFHGGFSRRGEVDDPWVAFAFRDCDPLDEAFVSLSRQVFHPLVEAVAK